MTCARPRAVNEAPYHLKALEDDSKVGGRPFDLGSIVGFGGYFRSARAAGKYWTAVPHPSGLQRLAFDLVLLFIITCVGGPAAPAHLYG